jgi:ribosomal protein S18 acetylase RimI-like enzyme
MASNWNSSATAKPTFNIRPWKFSDCKVLGALAAKAYYGTAITEFLSPYANKFFNDYQRSFSQRQRMRFLDPTSIGFVAFRPETNKSTGYIVARRCSAHAPSFSILSIPRRIMLFVLRKYFSFYYSIRNWFFPDRSINWENMKIFHASGDMDEKKHWAPYQNRWHAESLVIDPSFQGMGLGTTLMKKIMAMATEEKVPICLVASPQGEKLYRKLGFKFLSGFSNDFTEEGGGLMVWFPEGVDCDVPEEVLKSEQNQ